MPALVAQLRARPAPVIDDVDPWKWTSSLPLCGPAACPADFQRSPVCVGREHERALRAFEQSKHRIPLDAESSGM